MSFESVSFIKDFGKLIKRELFLDYNIGIELFDFYQIVQRLIVISLHMAALHN